MGAGAVIRVFSCRPFKDRSEKIALRRRIGDMMNS